MSSINFKHLRYFWMVARSGSVARAAERLHLTPHAVSGQIGQFEETLGVALFRRVGRRLELTEAGERILGHADEIFALGDEVLELLRDPADRPAQRLAIGIADSVPKSVASRLLAPALHAGVAIRLVCREGRLEPLLAELAVQRLDAVIADRPMPSTVGVRAYSHLLGDSALAVFGAPALVAGLGDDFPGLIDRAPFLMPGEDVAFRAPLLQWFAAAGLRPRVVGEFDDLALLKAFGQAGEGLFVAPAAIAPFICAQYDVDKLGEIAEVREHCYLITPARRLTHPAMIAIHRVARQELFAVPAGHPASDPPASELARSELPIRGTAGRRSKRGASR